MVEYSSSLKGMLHNAFDLMLDQIAALKREPNEREEEGLVRALGLMVTGSYERAAEVLLPMTKMIRATEGATGLARTTRKLCTIAVLRQGLRQIRALSPLEP